MWTLVAKEAQSEVIRHEITSNTEEADIMRFIMLHDWFEERANQIVKEVGLRYLIGWSRLL